MESLLTADNKRRVTDVARRAEALRRRSAGLGSSFAVPALVVVALIVPFAVGQNAYLVRIAGTIALYVILAVGLNIVVGFAGLLDLGYVGFYAIGAYTYAFLASPHFGIHLPFIAVLPIAAVLAALCGVLLGYPVLRLKGDYLAIVTMGFGEIIRILLVNLAPIANGPNGITKIDSANLLGLDLGRTLSLGFLQTESVTNYYYLGLAFAGGCVLVASRLDKSKIGRAWQAIRDDETAAQCLGIPKSNMKLLAFACGALFAGVAGVVFASWQQFVSPETFTLNEVVTIFCMIVLGGTGQLLGVVVGAIALVTLPEFLREYSIYRMAIYGAVLVLAMRYRPQGLLGRAGRPSSMRQTRLSTGLAVGRTVAAVPGPLAAETQSGVPMLEVAGLSKAFGGIKAVQDVSFTVSQGEIVSVIGPNGAGKTTLFNLISGLYKPSSGSIRYMGKSIGGKAPHRLAALGLMRTFQNLRLFGGMSVLDNVLVGLHSRLHAGLLPVVFHGARFRGEERAAREHALTVLAALGNGLVERHQDSVQTLTYADRRRVEIARALVSRPRLLLLDEPVAGMNGPEAEEMTAKIRALRDAGYAVLLIEHHMSVVMGISDRIVVLDQGRKIAEGTPTVVQNDERVVEAYLGRRRRRQWAKATV